MLTPEQEQGLNEFNLEIQARINRVREKWDKPSSARQKAIDYVNKRKQRIEEVKKWNHEK